MTAGAPYLVGSAESVPTELPTLHAFRSTSLVPRQGVKPYFAVGRIERGRSEWWSRGKIWRSAPGSLIVKEMGDYDGGRIDTGERMVFFCTGT